ncbi:Mor transcription activator family protein [Desulfonauticus submarinus]|uniref:Mor transcription activator family protein n=1 Tax=Desulfonauticus submarinus TaxID=206665 RepID=A0A1H0G9V9_9BACT|nr:Mor transcription activator family protein [Desulfonauticus submarinus]SDO03677.1 Mor transcription activator family protein [Desulfonauticus submarinus]
MDLFEMLYTDIKEGMSINQICEKYGGFQVYIPLPKRYIKYKIKKEFNGTNHKELARKYGLSVRQVYRILGGR